MKNFRFSQQRAVFIPYVKWKKKNKFFIKSATKRLLAYRYGARKENLTFFQNYSLNRGFHSLYGVKEEKFLKKCRKIELSGQCSMKREKLSSICIQTDSNSWVLVWKEENLFIFNLTFGSFRSLYGAKKIFYSTVGSYGVAWVVRVWKENQIFSSPT